MAESYSESPELDSKLIQSLRHQLTVARERLATIDDGIDATLKQIALLRNSHLKKRSQWWYCALAMGCRHLVDSTIVWRPGAILIVSTATAGIAVAAAKSASMMFVGAIFGAVISGALAIFRSDATIRNHKAMLESELPGISFASAELRSHLLELRKKRQAAWTQCEYLTSELREKEASLHKSAFYRRTRLLHRDWKSLRSVPFEHFLEEVFIELGYRVETTRVSGDQGVDLIVVMDQFRIAIQVKGYFHSVSNSAVQEAHAGMTFYDCHGCAVVTNSRFTQSATQLAEKIGCVLIDEDSLPGLILGKLEFVRLFRMAPKEIDGV